MSRFVAAVLRRQSLVLFGLAFAAFAALAPQDPGNFQITTRLALSLSIVQDGTLAIDRYAEKTGDKSQWEAHYYADKPPGHSLLAVPFIWAAQAGLELAGEPTDGLAPTAFRVYNAAATFGVNVLLAALAVVALFRTALALGASRDAALFGSCALALGTPLLGWSGAFFAHTVDASLLMIAMGIGVTWLADPVSGAARHPACWAFVFGTCLGYAPVVELTAAPVAAFGLALFALLVLRRPVRRFGVLAATALGAVCGVLPLIVYNLLAFGSPFHLGYESVVGFDAMHEGFFGISLPRPGPLVDLLVSWFRGLLPLAPALAVAPIALALMLRRKATALAALVILVVFANFYLINAGYHYWEGGWSLGPRHMIATLPFLALALCFAWPRQPALQLILGALVLLGLVANSIGAVGGLFPPEEFKFPLLQFDLLNLLRADAAGWRLWLEAAVVVLWATFWFLPRQTHASPVGSPAVTS